MSEIRELALEKAARILGGGATRADEPAEQYAIIVDFEIQTSRERALVIVVERTTREPSFETAAVASEFGLTQREAEVALSLANRRSSSEIARALGISPHTARRHAERVLDKLGIRSRREVADVLRRRRVVRG